MIAETIFYITGSVFFTLAVAMLGMFIYYAYKVLQKIVDIETEMKNAVTEVKIKIATFSIGLTGLVALLEKIVDFRNRRGRDKEEAAAKQEESPKEPAKKIRIKTIFTKGE